MSTLAQDLRHAVRMYVKQPGYFATALVTLALGIGFSTATFSVINAVLLRPLPYHEPSRLLIVRERRLPQFPEFSVSPGHYLTWRNQSSTLEAVGAWQTQSVNLIAGSRDPERVRADRVTANLFGLLGVTPIAGRAFTETDDQAGAPLVVMLSYGAWQRRFGGRSDVVGQTVRLDGQSAPIVGIMPADLAVPSTDTEMWVPMAFSPQERERYGSHYLSSVARLRPGVSIDQARSDLLLISQRLAIAKPDAGNEGWEPVLFPFHEFTVRNVQAGLKVLLGAVTLVLLIACVNVANLLLARGAARQRELAIRSAIGADRHRLVRQLLVEQVTLAIASAAAGVLVAAWLLRALLALLPNALPRQGDIRLDGTVLVFALALAALTPIVFGLFPALHVSRPDLRDLLSAGGRQGGAAPARRVRRALVIVEVALAMLLLVGAGLLIRSFGKLASVSPGFVPDHAIMAAVNIPSDRYKEGEPREQFFAELLSRTRALPQVAAAGLTQAVPMVGDYVSSLESEGLVVSDSDRPTTNFYAVSPDYFAAMRIPLVRGRLVSDGDRRGATRIVVINQSMADRLFPGADPIGRRIKVSQGADEWREIVGIVGDVKQYGLSERTTNQVYESYLQHPYFSGYSLVVRTAMPDSSLIVPELRGIVKSLDRELPLGRVRTLDEVVEATVRPQRFSTVLIGIFSASALLLAAIGIYGVVSYTVGLRTQEFAIRVAHGATRRDILALVLRGAAWMTGIGVIGGYLAAWLMRRSVENLLFGVDPGDWRTYLGVAAILATVSLIASAVPAIRATRVDPMTALRQ